MPAPDQPETKTSPEHADQQAPAGSLRGSFVAVLVMTAFFLVAWFGVLAIALERR